MSGIMTRNTTPSLAIGSRFGQRIQRRYGEQLQLLTPGVPQRNSMRQVFDALRAGGNDVASALRITRQLVLERLVQLDCDENASLSTVTGVMTELAEFALDIAFATSVQNLALAHGEPQTAQGIPAQLCIIGMGKLGARELNVSSDIDLIYVYDHDGETTGDASGRGRISNQEYFGKIVRSIYALVGEATEHGFVFRVDLALRPNGNSGPPAVSLGAL